MRRGAASESSRAATDRLLSDLRGQGWTPQAWIQFFGDAFARSAEQARSRPQALLEVCLLHALYLVAARTGGRRWVAGSWVLSALHLGMLEERTSLGLANFLTLARANLPAAAAIPEPWMPTIATATDFLDGRLARRTDTTTAFGRYADAFADAAFWVWTTRDDATATRAAVAGIWMAPIAWVVAASIARGAMVEGPRPRLVRPAAAVQVALTTRNLGRRWARVR